MPTSLWDVGYRTAGIDGGWEACVNHSYHDAAGRPMINTALFPDMGAMVEEAHVSDVKVSTRILGGNTMRGAARTNERWERRHTPTQDPSTDLRHACPCRSAGT